MRKLNIAPIAKDPRHVAIAAEIASLAAALARLDEAIEKTAAQPMPASEVQAAMVADALHYAETGTLRPAQHTTEDHMAALARQRAVIAAALAGKQQAMRELVSELSAALCRDLAGEHRALAGRMVAALEAFDALQGEDADMRAALEAAGYRPTFPAALAWPTIGRLSEVSASPIWHHAAYLRRCAAT